MVTVDTFRNLALSLPGSVEEPHFEKPSFRVNKKIFATLDIKNNRGCLMMNEIDQSVFSQIEQGMFYAVPNKWGAKGATFVDLTIVSEDILQDALLQAYNKLTLKTKKNIK